MLSAAAGLLVLVLLLVGATTLLSASPASADVDCSLAGDDQFEENDDVASATVMTSGVTVEAHACEGDVDYFAVDVSPGDTIDVFVEFIDAEGDIDAYLFNPAGVELAEGISTDDNENLSVVAADAGLHVVQVQMFTQQDDNNYQITLTVTPPCDAGDVYEDNDDRANATSATSGDSYQAKACTSDPDFFAISAAAGDTIDVLVEFGHAGGNIDASLSGTDSGVLALADSTTDNEVMSVVAEATGVHHVEIGLAPTGGNDYTLTITITSPDVNSFPYVETFGTATCELPSDWTQSATNTEDWLFDAPAFAANPAQYGANADHTDGAGCIAWVDSSSPYDAQPAVLLSPVFNLTSLTEPQLEFWYQNQSASSSEPIYSALSIDVYDGTDWVTDVFTIDSKVADWTRFRVDLTSFVSGLTQIRFNGTEQSTWFDSDISLDDVRVLQLPANDLAVREILSPGICGLTSTELLRIEVQNMGIQPISQYDVTVVVNGVSAGTTTVVDQIPVGAISVFETVVDLSEVRVHTIEVELGADDDMANNSMQANLQNLGGAAISTFPYTESFEGTDGGWSADGTNSSWERGVPAGTVINSAFDGNEVWATGLAADYANNEQSYVQSPCFDFSEFSQSSMPEFSLGIYLDSEFSWDGAALQYSNDLQNWTTIGSVGDEYNWYNDDTIAGLAGWSGSAGDGWSGTTASWVVSSNALSELAGVSDAVFRIAFGSDETTTGEGFAFDRVRIAAPLPGGFVPLNPARILDSRPGALNVGEFATPWGPGETRAIQVQGVGGVPAGIDAVALHVTTVSPSAGFSWLTVSPTGQTPATTAVHTFGTGAETSQIVNDVIIAKVGELDGRINVRNETGNVDLVVDVVGYSTRAGGFGYVPLSPARILDSRSGSLNVGAFSSPWGPDQTRAVQVLDVGGVPSSGVEAVVLNVTTVSPTAPSSWLTVSPTGEAQAATAAHNFGTASVLTEVVNDVVIAKVGTGGTIDVRNEAGTVDLVVDVVGYYASEGGFSYLPLNPMRILDSRNAFEGGFSTPWPAGTSRTVETTFGDCADAVVLHVTTVSPSADFSWLTVSPAGEAPSITAAHNFGTASFTTAIRNDVVLAKTGTGGDVDIRNETGTVDVVIDLVGVYGANDCAG